MKSPFVKSLVIAFLFAVISYFVSANMELSSLAIAIIVFICALASSSISGVISSGSENPDVKTLYVGNLPYRANESMVKSLFETYGTVHSVRLMKDKQTGKRRGFGFVEMSAENIDATITALNDTEFQQRTLKVREAKDKPEQ